MPLSTLLLAAVSSAHAGTITVCPLGTLDAACQHHTVGSALLVAQPGDVIEIAEGRYPTSATVTIPVTLRGAGNAVLTANGMNTSPLIRVTAPVAVTLEDLVLEGDLPMQAGRQGVVVQNGAELTVRRTSFVHHRGDVGGAMLVDDASADLYEVSFVNNKALDGGGAIAVVNGAEVTWTDGTATGNLAPLGGAVAVFSGSFHAQAVHFSGHTAHADLDGDPSGGALAASDAAITLNA